MNIKDIYFIGIKGVGMTALAVYCKEKGFNVAGSDNNEYFHTDEILKKADIPVHEFETNKIDSHIDLVIFSGAYEQANNKELKKAQELGIRIMSHGEALGYFMRGSFQISVSGTHGKTTTTALIATILTQGKLKPSYVIGAASIDPLGNPGHYGKGKYFIAEADEYQTALNENKKPRFMWQNPSILVITNIDFDHPDVYRNIDSVKQAFKKLVNKVPKDGVIVYNLKDENLVEVLKDVNVKKIGFNNSSPTIKMNIIGKHNRLNVDAAVTVSRLLDIKNNVIKNAIKKFKGAKRRLEKVKESNGILYYDDYAHHPTEIKATIEAFKAKYPKKRLIVVFQPHTYSRTEALLKRFSSAFDRADIIVLTHIFASAREKQELFKVTHEDLYKMLKERNKQVFLASNNDQVVQYITDIAKNGDIVLTMGAGDIYKVHKDL